VEKSYNLNMSLRQRAIKGGAFLLVREAAGIAVSIVGVLLVTRIIGPREYGLFGAGAGIATFLLTLGPWGLDVYLLRKTETPQEEEFDQVFTLFLVISIALVCGAFLARRAIAATLKMPEESSLLVILAPAVMLNLLAVPAIVKLARDLDFKQVALNELISQSAYYIVAVPLAFGGAKAWAPAAGFLTQQATLLTLSYWKAKFRPRLHWEIALIKKMFGYGLSYTGSMWVYQLRNLVNPIIVGRLAGAEAVGYIAVSIRIVQVLTFAKDATQRIAMAALAKLNRDPVRLRGVITEGMRFQAVAVGVPLASFALFAPFLVPFGLGHHWIPALKVFPYIALSYLSNAMFNLHTTVLYLLKKNVLVAWFHIVQIILFAGGTIVFVPRIGFVGYGWAEVLGLLSYLTIHSFLAQAVGRPSYAAPAIWYVSAICAIVAGTLGFPLLYFGFLILFAPLLFSAERSVLAGYARLLLSGASA
jgi:O-antigen/teichoic acid export membrane protein